MYNGRTSLPFFTRDNVENLILNTVLGNTPEYDARTKARTCVHFILAFNIDDIILTIFSFRYQIKIKKIVVAGEMLKVI